MAERVIVSIGTKKGVFVAEASKGRLYVFDESTIGLHRRTWPSSWTRSTAWWTPAVRSSWSSTTWRWPRRRTGCSTWSRSVRGGRAPRRFLALVNLGSPARAAAGL